MIGRIVNKICDIFDHSDKEPISEIYVTTLTYALRCGGLICIGMLVFMFTVLNWTFWPKLYLLLFKG